MAAFPSIKLRGVAAVSLYIVMVDFTKGVKLWTVYR